MYTYFSIRILVHIFLNIHNDYVYIYIYTYTTGANRTRIYIYIYVYMVLDRHMRIDVFTKIDNDCIYMYTIGADWTSRRQWACAHIHL